ncbi:FAD-binding domain-containing protein [Lyngbya sp. PCC 8106]|uniref:FAD-binding domain-containing protein n=1 Tax=Lyngbya sp. (strain PCC 8106) TaxID=313612 RepID=UPI0000EA90E7|nr:FAD-binding domain-containing protein [Lyngbya sp. PCC 8106]EAW35095.1 deoxyribodipyrimidine photolyase [Lyngbya sp. PCC 8106]
MQILWFRRDLRLIDNDIVAQAAATDEEILPCFIIDPWFYQQPDIGGMRVQFLFESLACLDGSLRDLGSRLYLFEGNSVEVIQTLTGELLELGYHPRLVFNRDIQVDYGRKRDHQVIEFYQRLGLNCYLGLNNFLQIEGENREQWMNEYYADLRQPQHPIPTKLKTPEIPLNLTQLTFDELQQKYNFNSQNSALFTGGEVEAQKTLNSWLKSRYNGYHWKLSRPQIATLGGTSHLSAHLAFGTISTRQVYQQTKARANELKENAKAQFALKSFRNCLRWRDSAIQRLYYFPELAYQNCYPEFDKWYSDGELEGEKLEYFQAWQQGKTGFPLVDASMKQLQSMGWMNFRMRAMCANFLTVICGVSWHHGARHYMNYLVDGDIAINHWQWQAQAGVTNPLSSTFRIYNPTKNLTEKDPKFEFVRDWIPELRDCTDEQILSGEIGELSGYPEPMLDWYEMRKINGKVVSELRKQVKKRLEQEQGIEYERAMGLSEAIGKYWSAQEQRYQQYKQIAE